MTPIISTENHVIGQFILSPVLDGDYRLPNGHILHPVEMTVYKCVSAETTAKVLSEQYATQGFNRAHHRAQAAIATPDTLDVPLVSPSDVKRVLQALLREVS